MNAPDKSELFVVPEDKNKVEFVEDTKIPNAGTFTIYLENHTLGNLMRMQLLKDRDVRFAGYRMPHPLENKIEIKVQTNGEKRPTEAFTKAIDGINEDIKSTLKEFDKKVKEYLSNKMH